MTFIDEDSFVSQVLRSARPVLALFMSKTCAASAEIWRQLQQLIGPADSQLKALRIDVEQSGELAEQYGVVGTPTLLVFRYGDVLTRVVGYVPSGLLEVLLTQLREETLPRDLYWQPLETLVEDRVILPLLDRCGFAYQRQVACKLPEGYARKRGRVDVLVFQDLLAPPLTLIESKRILRSENELYLAAQQAIPYARAFELNIFCVAAPSGLWLFRRSEAKAVLEQALSFLDLQREPGLVLKALGSVK